MNIDLLTRRQIFNYIERLEDRVTYLEGKIKADATSRPQHVNFLTQERNAVCCALVLLKDYHKERLIKEIGDERKNSKALAPGE